MAQMLVPGTFEAAAAALSGAAADGDAVRILGGQTKRRWGAAIPEADLELSTHALDRIVEHNEGDLTATLEAGVPLARAQERFAQAGQRLSLDPWLGADEQATIGGIIATGDSGPLAHRYGGPRDLVLGMTVALSDGTIAQSGGKVIKNVAGYDIGKLFCGSFGTLGLILSVNVRLHPLSQATSTALAVSRDPHRLAPAARELAAKPLELESLDVAWHGDRGGVLARAAGATPRIRAERAAGMLAAAGLEQVEVVDDDDEVWARQRSGQRSRSLALVRVAARATMLEQVIAAAQASGGTLVSRVALGTSSIELDPDALWQLHGRLPACAASVVLDAPRRVHAGLSPWGEVTDEPALKLMRTVKARFDPAGVCNPGIFVGGI
jgi:glycolate oxidase FAD binding subunit